MIYWQNLQPLLALPLPLRVRAHFYFWPLPGLISFVLVADLADLAVDAS